MREADEDPAAGCIEELARVVGQIRGVWPEVRIVLRGDSGFCREEVTHWCEAQRVDYVLGLAKNGRLREAIAEELAEAQREYERTGGAGVQGFPLPNLGELVY